MHEVMIRATACLSAQRFPAVYQLKCLHILIILQAKNTSCHWDSWLGYIASPFHIWGGLLKFVLFAIVLYSAIFFFFLRAHMVLNFVLIYGISLESMPEFSVLGMKSRNFCLSRRSPDINMSFSARTFHVFLWLLNSTSCI